MQDYDDLVTDRILAREERRLAAEAASYRPIKLPGRQGKGRSRAAAKRRAKREGR
jgi:hypothetical protein